MNSFRIGNGTSEDFEFRVDWVLFLLSEKGCLETYNESWTSSPSRRTFLLTMVDGSQLSFVREQESGECFVVSTTPLSSDNRAVVKESLARAKRGDQGLTQWWEFSFESQIRLDAAYGINLLRALGQRRAYRGQFRLGQDVLVDFSTADDKQIAAFAKQAIKIRFRSVGPGRGPGATKIAKKLSDVVRVVLSFATASALENGLFVKPLNDETFLPGRAVSSDVPELLTNGVAIWRLLDELFASGASELANRILNSLTAFEHAMAQPTAGAATIFYVTAIEALTVPNSNYAARRVTARFKNSLSLLAEAKLEAALKHVNAREAFFEDDQKASNASRLAERIYHLRSSSVHSGQVGSSRTIAGFDSSVGDSARIALLAEIAEAAIINFIVSPVSSLIGHPRVDPDGRFEFSDKEHEALRRAAGVAGLGVGEFIRQTLNLPAR
jgi:hypothetical protein